MMHRPVDHPRNIYRNCYLDDSRNDYIRGI